MGSVRRSCRRTENGPTHDCPHITLTGIRDDVVNDDVAAELLGCDHVFLAANTMRARLLIGRELAVHRD